jgi:hypothetical protein
MVPAAAHPAAQLAAVAGWLLRKCTSSPATESPIDASIDRPNLPDRKTARHGRTEIRGCRTTALPYGACSPRCVLFHQQACRMALRYPQVQSRRQREP